MDRNVKAALLAVAGLAFFIVGIFALPRTAASLIMDLDIPGEGVLAAMAVVIVTIGLGAFAWCWSRIVLRLLARSEPADHTNTLLHRD